MTGRWLLVFALVACGDDAGHGPGEDEHAGHEEHGDEHTANEGSGDEHAANEGHEDSDDHAGPEKNENGDEHAGHDHGHPPDLPAPQVPADLTWVARVARLEGEGATVRREAAGEAEPLVARASLEGGSVLETGAATMVLDHRDGSRLTLGPGTRARLAGEARGVVLLAAGWIHGVYAAAGERRQPLRIATPAATVEMGGSTGAVVAALPDGNTWAACIEGLGEVTTGAGDAATGPTATSLTAGQSLLVTAGRPPPAPTEGAPDLAAAKTAAETAARAARPAAAAALRQRSARAASELDAAVTAYEEERTRGTELEEAHRAATGADRAEKMRAIVEHSQRRFRSGRLVLARWERVAALSLRTGDTSQLTSREERVRPILAP